MQNKVEIMVYKMVKWYRWDFDTRYKILKTDKTDMDLSFMISKLVIWRNNIVDIDTTLCLGHTCNSKVLWVTYYFYKEDCISNFYSFLRRIKICIEM